MRIKHSNTWAQQDYSVKEILIMNYAIFFIVTSQCLQHQKNHTLCFVHGRLPIGSCIWTLSDQLGVLSVEPLRGEPLLEEAGHGERAGLEVLQPDSTSCLHSASWLRMWQDQQPPDPVAMVSPIVMEHITLYSRQSKPSLIQLTSCQVFCPRNEKRIHRMCMISILSRNTAFIAVYEILGEDKRRSAFGASRSLSSLGWAGLTSFF